MSYCDQCEYKASGKALLKFHQQAKHLGAKFPCSECSFKANSSVYIRHHFRAKHMVMAHICKFCNIQFSSNSNMIYHRTVAHSSNVFNCTQCDYKTKIKRNLAKHMGTTHEDGQIGYTCKYCDFHANQRQLIFQHMVVHPNARKSRSKLKHQDPISFEFGANPGEEVTTKSEEEMETHPGIKVEDELC